VQKWLLNISFQSKEEGTLAKCWTKIMWDKGNRGWYTLERGPWEDTADIYWSQAKKSRFLVEESRTWQNTTIIFWWRRLKHLQLMLLVWPSRPMATHIKMGGKHLKHVNLWHVTCHMSQTLETCKFVTRMWRRQLQFSVLSSRQKLQLLCVIFFFCTFAKDSPKQFGLDIWQNHSQ